MMSSPSGARPARPGRRAATGLLAVLLLPLTAACGDTGGLVPAGATPTRADPYICGRGARGPSYRPPIPGARRPSTFPGSRPSRTRTST